MQNNGIAGIASTNSSWLTERILSVLHRLGVEPYLDQGLQLVKKRKILDFHVSPGMILAKVQGERYRPYNTTLEVRTFSEDEWGRVFAVMSQKALFAAKLLAGELPAEFDLAFVESGVRIFPLALDDPADLVNFRCDCEGNKRSCEHLAALYFLVNEKFEADPFLAFALRGRSARETLSELRRLRRSLCNRNEPAIRQFYTGLESIEALPLSEALPRYWNNGATLASLQFTIRADELPGTILRQLEPCPAGDLIYHMDQVLDETYAYVANRAQAFGLGLS